MKSMLPCSISNYFDFYSSIPLFDKDIDNFKNAKQQVSDCYLMSTIEAFSKTENGRKILRNQIRYDKTNPKIINCYLHNLNGKQENFSINSAVASEGYENLYKQQNNKFIRALDISVAQYEQKYKSKPWICRISEPFKTFKFENNLPSHFMEVLTGVKPRTIAERDFNLSLKPYKKEVMELFSKMEKEKNYNFVIGTGIKKLDGRRFHVYVIENIDLQNNKITVKEKRKNTPVTMDIDDALNKFKYITGYLDSDLKISTSKLN